MTKVYVLQGKYYGDWQVLGVFSSKPKVNEAIKWLREVDTYWNKHPDWLCFSTYELNGERIG